MFDKQFNHQEWNHNLDGDWHVVVGEFPQHQYNQTWDKWSKKMNYKAAAAYAAKVITEEWSEFDSYAQEPEEVTVFWRNFDLVIYRRYVKDVVTVFDAHHDPQPAYIAASMRNALKDAKAAKLARQG